MSKSELRLSKTDVEKGGSPEVLIEFYKDNEFLYASYVSSKENNGKYDKVKARANVDGDKDTDEKDDKIILDLANAFHKFASD